MSEDKNEGSEELVSVVIPAKDEEDAIASCIRSIQEQDWRNLQILVVDGASTDDTARIIHDISEYDPRVEYLYNPRGIIPVSLNMALAQARGRFLVRVDAHAQIPFDYVRRCVEHLAADPSLGAVGGRKDGVGRTAQGRAIAVAMASRFGVGNSTYHYGEQIQEVEHVPFGAYPVALARSLGGWDEDLRVNQDFEFDYRVRESGHRILFDPALTIDWESRQSLRALFAQYRRYGRGKVKVMAKHPSSVSPRHLVAPALVAELATAAAVAPRQPRLAGLMVAPYALGLGVAAVTTAPRLEHRADAVFLPGAFAAMHVGWGIGFYLGLADQVRTRLRGDSS